VPHLVSLYAPDLDLLPPHARRRGDAIAMHVASGRRPSPGSTLLRPSQALADHALLPWRSRQGGASRRMHLRGLQHRSVG
jgi:hypothetical protein